MSWQSWKRLAGKQIDPDALASLVAASIVGPRVDSPPVLSGWQPIVVSWQRVGGSIYVTFR